MPVTAEGGGFPGGDQRRTTSGRLAFFSWVGGAIKGSRKTVVRHHPPVVCCVLPPRQGKSLSGRRLNVSNSLQVMNLNDMTPPGIVGGFQVTSQNGRSMSLSWTASGDDGPIGQASLYDISFVDQTTGAIVPLTSVTPAAPGTPQSVSINIPYRHTNGTIRLREFDKAGNEGTPATV